MCASATCAWSRRRIVVHARDDRVEVLEMVGDRRRPQSVIQRLLTERALSAIEMREDVVEVKISPVRSSNEASGASPDPCVVDADAPADA